MSMQHKVEIKSLVAKATVFSNASGEVLVCEFEKNIAILLQWVDYLDRNYSTTVASELISACSSVVREAASYLALGLIRPVIFCLRTVIDLCLAWLYFKDHPVEWSRVNVTGDGFKMKKDIFDYLTSHIDGFSNRIGILRSCHSRKVEDVYRFLSAHIHGQSTPVLHRVHTLSEVVFDKAYADEAIEVAYSTAEYISDVLVSTYAHAWHSLPEDIKGNVENRLVSKPQKLKFFEGI